MNDANGVTLSLSAKAGREGLPSGFKDWELADKKAMPLPMEDDAGTLPNGFDRRELTDRRGFSPQFMELSRLMTAGRASVSRRL
ncbi:MAG: hypothetical protein LBP22_05715 [Deltaproteobacteria bacterium]|jgi:hypothetical protein|nr:hypothetical protein [Deltaproteobacteria bacterium]